MNSVDDKDLETHSSYYMVAETGKAIATRRQQMVEADKCLDCFMFNSCCICDNVRKIYENAIHDSFNTCIEIFMHYKEWGRSSNTGKLMQIGLPNNSTTNIYGIDEQKLSQTIANNPSLILYPRPDAKPISEFREWFKSLEGRVHIVVIDSTWPQSYAMDKALPSSVPRVKISEMIIGPSEFLNRKQSANKNKVSTIEATAMALQALQYHTTEQLDAFTQSLRYAVDGVLRQNGKAPAYGNIIIPKATRYGGPYNKVTIHKPTACVVCHMTIEQGANFRNEGVRKKFLRDIQEDFLENSRYLQAEEMERRTKREETKTIEQDDEEGLAIDQSVQDSGRYMIEYRVWKCTACKNFFATSIDGEYELSQTSGEVTFAL